ncbi:MAG: hypothetical protein IIY39_00040 [Firmicutes bacterium]|nr:hypothetical protein [Bacillota bacterium]
MNLFEQLQKQRYEALKVFGNEMWGVVVHAQTYRELVAECLDGRAVFRIGDVCTTPNGDYIFGLRIIPSFGVAPNTFTIVDKRLGENILGTEAWYKADHKTEPTHNQHVQHIGSVETMSCEECKHFHENAVMYLDQCDFYFKDCKYEPKCEPQTCEECEHWGDTEDGCADRHGCKITERSE